MTSRAQQRRDRGGVAPPLVFQSLNPLEHSLFFRIEWTLGGRGLKSMLAFRITLNGQKIATAGLPGPHVVSASVVSVDRRERSQANGSPAPNELDLTLSGIEDGGTGTRGHVSWGHRNLKIGDEVRIEIVDTDSVDPPNRDANT